MLLISIVALSKILMVKAGLKDFLQVLGTPSKNQKPI
jgi:hypothetical protein